MRRRLALCFALLCPALACAQSQTAPQPKEGDFVLHDFHFRSGETLPELRLHYATLGTPVRDAHGTVQNAVIILHGTTRSGKTYLNAAFMALYAPGHPLDVSRWYVILPDSIGHGKSSKPSDGLHAHFPHPRRFWKDWAGARLIVRIARHQPATSAGNFYTGNLELPAGLRSSSVSTPRGVWRRLASVLSQPAQFFADFDFAVARISVEQVALAKERSAGCWE